MRCLFLPAFFFLTACFIQNSANGQSTLDDSSFYKEAVTNAIRVFRQSENDQSRLFNGRQYKPYTFTFIKGVPFFSTDEFAAGTIDYDGSSYDSVQLLYDEIKELVIINLGSRVELTNERISRFTIGKHEFIHLKKDSLNQLPATGFYERLYAGKTGAYKKEKKFIKDHLSVSEGYQAEAFEKKFYYLRKDNRFYLVKRKKDILNILKDKKAWIQEYMKVNSLNFKTGKEGTLAGVAAYYDQLTR